MWTKSDRTKTKKYLNKFQKKEILCSLVSQMWIKSGSTIKYKYNKV